MIKHTMALALSLTAVTLPAAAHAVTQVTSLDTGTTPWTVQNVTTSGPITNAVVPSSVPGTYNGGSSNPTIGGARWIRPSASTNENGQTTFAFTKIFSLPNFAILSTAVLSGNYWSDNGIVSILLNGNNLVPVVSNGTAGGAPQSTFMSTTGTPITPGTGFFQFGTNTLVFNVRNGGTSPNPVALRGDLQVAAAVPEPGTWMLMLLGFGAIGFAMRSRAKTQVRFQFA